MGKEIKNGVRIPWLLVLDIIAIGFIAEYLLLFEFRGVNSYVARNVASIFSVSLLIILTLLCQLLGKCKWLMKILSTAGKYSLELYMAHVTVRNFTGTLGFDLRDPRIIFIMVVASLVWAAVIHIAAQGIYSLLDRKRPKTI